MLKKPFEMIFKLTSATRAMFWLHATIALQYQGFWRANCVPDEKRYWPNSEAGSPGVPGGGGDVVGEQNMALSAGEEDDGTGDDDSVLSTDSDVDPEDVDSVLSSNDDVESGEVDSALSSGEEDDGNREVDSILSGGVEGDEGRAPPVRQTPTVPGYAIVPGHGWANARLPPAYTDRACDCTSTDETGSRKAHERALDERLAHEGFRRMEVLGDGAS